LIKIRYSDLPPGLHARVGIEGRHTVVYLLPGLTPRQRAAALHRVRSSGRVGHGPRLPARAMARAIAADQLRTTLRNGASAMRSHPALLIPPLIFLVSGALAFFLLTSVSIVYQPEPAVHGGAPAVPRTGHRAAGRPGLPDDHPVVITPVAAHPSPPARHHGRRPGGPSSPAPSRSPSPSASPTPAPRGPSPRPTGPVPDPTPSSDPPPSPAPSPSPPNGGGVCVRVGDLGVCLDL
jgi:hypothetical protein